jgi:lactate racemase
MVDGFGPSIISAGQAGRTLSEDRIRDLVAKTFQTWDLSHQRVLVIVPDGTRTAPIPLIFRMLYENLSTRVDQLDCLIALGTHPPMSEESINKLLGITPQERAERYRNVRIYNHQWSTPETFITVGVLSPEQTSDLSQGRLSLSVPVRINRLVLDYDVLLVCGPVFPHEVAGFSGGSKYFSPGISGPEIINFTHWLGALITSYEMIGVKDTPVREVIERVAEMIPRPKLCISLVMLQEKLAGYFAGELRAAWSAAADLSAQINIRYLDHSYAKVLSVMPEMYDDLWTGAKGMYKLEPVVADGGELIIYAPHIREISYTHGRIIDQIGYHIRDYFVKQWDKYQDIPWGVLAHSTHLRGIGEYLNGVEFPRIQVTLATGIPEERTRQVNLNFLDPASIRHEDWEDQEDILVVPKAGEVLYRKEPATLNSYTAKFDEQ